MARVSVRKSSTGFVSTSPLNIQGCLCSKPLGATEGGCCAHRSFSSRYVLLFRLYSQLFILNVHPKMYPGESFLPSAQTFRIEILESGFYITPKEDGCMVTFVCHTDLKGLPSTVAR